ncbi:MAG: undecaprenyldiphospho-muramoylpentapeptide beta-N-acetylglucosaminyltransferase [Armatimonadetes bacterium]|nr:undecaprenyldiphospho-muramoylpentapeptide beta-N-acetylglucosaminyltransferase [Armatimonadota bacterium]
MNDSIRVVIAGGGTGGHLYPGLAVAEALAPSTSVLFVGTPNGLEARVVPRLGFSFLPVRSRHVSSRNPFKNALSLIEVARGVGQSFGILRKFRPDIVVGTGGYASGPAIVAARIAGIPAVIMEQNVLPGKATKYLAPFAGRVLASFAETVRYLPGRSKVDVPGNPVRKEILRASRDEALARFGMDGIRKVILVSGASQGSQRINRTVLEMVQRARELRNWQILHLTGEKLYCEVDEERRKLSLLDSEIRYEIMPYCDHMGDAYAVADIVLSRAGATTCAELTARGIPAVLIPYPHHRDRHQEHNARTLERHGAAVVLLEDSLSGEVLLNTLSSLLNDADRLERMAFASRSLGKPQASEEIVEILYEIIRCRRKD